MDIYRPKAAHSIREFLIEIGTIICGILIALGLEQALEWIHWRHAVERAEESLIPEVQQNLLDSYERVALRRCMEPRLAMLRDALLAPGDGWQGCR